MTTATKYRTRPGQIPGPVFNLGGFDYTFAPLNLRQVEELESTIAKIGEAKEIKDVAPLARKIILASLSRNYPDITARELSEILDLGQLRPAMQAVLGVSGFEAKPSGEPAPGGA